MLSSAPPLCSSFPIASAQVAKISVSERLDVADAEVIGQDNDNVWRTLRSGEGIIAGKARYGEEEGNKEVHHAAVQHSWAKEDAQAALVLFVANRQVNEATAG